jgi:hypothetical protein
MTTTMLQKPNYKQGDVVLVLFPNSDLITAKTRPAVVVQLVYYLYKFLKTSPSAPKSC